MVFQFLKELRIEIQILSSFFIFHFHLKNEKPNLLKQISYGTISHPSYAITRNKYKRIKWLIIVKHQILVNKHLPVQTPRSKHGQRISDLFKLINKDAAVINILF